MCVIDDVCLLRVELDEHFWLGEDLDGLVELRQLLVHLGLGGHQTERVVSNRQRVHLAQQTLLLFN